MRFTRWMASTPVRCPDRHRRFKVVWGYTEGTIAGYVVGTIGLFPIVSHRDP